MWASLEKCPRHIMKEGTGPSAIDAVAASLLRSFTFLSIQKAYQVCSQRRPHGLSVRRAGYHKQSGCTGTQRFSYACSAAASEPLHGKRCSAPGPTSTAKGPVGSYNEVPNSLPSVSSTVLKCCLRPLRPDACASTAPIRRRGETLSHLKLSRSGSSSCSVDAHGFLCQLYALIYALRRLDSRDLCCSSAAQQWHPR